MIGYNTYLEWSFTAIVKVKLRTCTCSDDYNNAMKWRCYSV